MEYKKKGYLKSYFRFFHLKDQHNVEFPAHYHDFDKIILFLGGDVKYVIEGQTYELFPYDILFVGHHSIHYPIIDSSVPYERIVMYIDPAYLRQHSSENGNLAHCFEYAKKNNVYVMHLDEKKNNPIISQIQTLEKSLNNNAFAQDLYTRISLLTLMVLINRGIIDKELIVENNVSYDKHILAVLNYINNNLLSELNIEELSRRFYISKYYLMRKFKQHTGYSIHQYILNKRLILAKEKILTGQSLTEICYACGFKDYSVFSRKFKSVFKKTPREYKKSLTVQPIISYHREGEYYE